MRDKELRIALQAVGDLRVIPAEVPRVDEHGIAETKITNLLDLVLDRRGNFHFQVLTALRMIEGKFRIDRPDLQVRVDQQPLLGLEGNCRLSE